MLEGLKFDLAGDRSEGPLISLLVPVYDEEETAGHFAAL